MDLTPRAKGFFAVFFFAIAVFTFTAFLTYSPGDWPFDTSSSVRLVDNISGPFGSVLAWLSFELLGRLFSWLLPLMMLVLGVATLSEHLGASVKHAVKVAAVVFLLGALFALTPFTREIASVRGWVGDSIAAALALVFGEVGSTIVLIAVLLLLVLGGLGRVLSVFPRFARAFSYTGQVGRFLGRGITSGFARAVGGATGKIRSYRERKARGARGAVEAAGAVTVSGERAADLEDSRVPGVPLDGDEERTPIEILTAERSRRSARGPAAKIEREKPSVREKTNKKPLEQASLPPLSLLEQGEGVERSYSKETLKNWSSILEQKLANYGVEGRVSAVHHGPVVTTFELEPATGVRIKDIVSRADDLALAMKARSLRMIAPIPGRAAVGIEIPNPESKTVYFYDVLGAVSEKQRLLGVMLAIGVDVVGQPYIVNLCAAPHLLVAGTTGSGKSVCLNAILSSILFQYRPSDVRIILVDPKMVEMAMYSGIPHLLHPVITEPKEAAHVLEYLTAEMMRRNKLFRRHGVKNIESMNSKITLGKWGPDEEPPERLPYIVVVIDELGDLALAKGVDIETLLARLAQTARAAGIHMVLATQRPSVDVIVGKTKANFPTRIAFRVATKVDSRTIIDTIGAEKLLGKGDMLFTDARNPQPLRLHGAWVSENDLEKLIAHWKFFEFDESRIDLHAARTGAAQIDDELDPLFGEAKGVVINFRQGSTSLLQRKLHVGYARAARILDQLEQGGIVGPADGSKPREVYVESVDEALDK